MDERRLELKVGALAVVALGIAGALVVALAGLARGPTFRMYADFGYAGGLPPGALVKIAGVKVGRVTDVEFRPEAADAEGKAIPVRLVLELDRDAARALRTDASAAVGTQGALGESHLELLTGTAPERLGEDAVVRGLDPPRLDVILARFVSVLESAANDEAFRMFLVRVAHLAGTLETVLRDNKAELAKVFRDFAAIVGDGRAAIQDVRAAARGASALLARPELSHLIEDLAVTAKAARTEVPGLLADARSLADKLDRTAGALTPDDVEKVKQTLSKLEQVTTHLQKISGNADQLLAGLQKGEGTAGKLLKDPAVYDDLKAFLTDLRKNPAILVWGK